MSTQFPSDSRIFKLKKRSSDFNPSLWYHPYMLYCIILVDKIHCSYVHACYLTIITLLCNSENLICPPISLIRCHQEESFLSVLNVRLGSVLLVNSQLFVFALDFTVDFSFCRLYLQISAAEFVCPLWFPAGAKALIHKILDPNPKTVSRLICL